MSVARLRNHLTSSFETDAHGGSVAPARPLSDFFYRGRRVTVFIDALDAAGSSRGHAEVRHLGEVRCNFNVVRQAPAEMIKSTLEERCRRWIDNQFA